MVLAHLGKRRLLNEEFMTRKGMILLAPFCMARKLGFCIFCFKECDNCQVDWPYRASRWYMSISNTITSKFSTFLWPLYIIPCYLLIFCMVAYLPKYEFARLESFNRWWAFIDAKRQYFMYKWSIDDGLTTWILLTPTTSYNLLFFMVWIHYCPNIEIIKALIYFHICTQFILLFDITSKDFQQMKQTERKSAYFVSFMLLNFAQRLKWQYFFFFQAITNWLSIRISETK